MNYHQASLILVAFSEMYPNFILDESIYKVAVELNYKLEFEINIYHNPNIDSKSIIDKYKLAYTFIQNNKKNKNIEYKISLKTGVEIREQCVLAGTSINPTGEYNFGTYGWGFILDGKAIAVSNWHVICPNGNDSVYGVEIDGVKIDIDGQKKAYLSSYEAVSDDGSNKWDIAFATFYDKDDMIKAFISCANGVSKTYPQYVQTNSPTFGTRAYKVGAGVTDDTTNIICNEGTFNGVVAINVLSTDRSTDRSIRRNFISQLQFTKMTLEGDSGAVIVNSCNAEIVGLNFAGDDDFTYANPVFDHPYMSRLKKRPRLVDSIRTWITRWLNRVFRQKKTCLL